MPRRGVAVSAWISDVLWQCTGGPCIRFTCHAKSARPDTPLTRRRLPAHLSGSAAHQPALQGQADRLIETLPSAVGLALARAGDPIRPIVSLYFAPLFPPAHSAQDKHIQRWVKQKKSRIRLESRQRATDTAFASNKCWVTAPIVSWAHPEGHNTFIPGDRYKARLPPLTSGLAHLSSIATQTNRLHTPSYKVLFASRHLTPPPISRRDR